MQIEDWRLASPGEVRDLLDRERRRWVASLAWDPVEAWAIVEEGRLSGTLPGFVARDARRIVGWTFFAVHDGVLRIGALEGARAESVRALLEAILDAPETAFATQYHAFLYAGHASVEPAFARRRFRLERHAYLSRPLSQADVVAREPQAAGLRTYRPTDLPGLVRLLAHAYIDDDLARCFAPHGRLDEWAAYVNQVVRGPALGRFAPGCSWVSGSGTGAQPDGGLLATWISPGTLHIVQLAVGSNARRRGLARHLVRAAVSAAATDGASRVTLMVAASNAAAAGLYRTLGFVERGSFLFGWRERPTRVVSARVPRQSRTLLAG